MSAVHEIAKLYLPTASHAKFDVQMVTRAQRKVRVKLPALLKFMRGLVVYGNYLYKDQEGEASPSHMVFHQTNDLYMQLRLIGYVWEAKRKLWRLRKGLKSPRYSNFGGE